MRQTKDFKSNEFGSADSERVAGIFCGSADSTGFSRREWRVERLTLRGGENDDRVARISVEAARMVKLK